jgi:hypothetical protein
MPIANYQNFHYRGYTLGGAQPTLYFDEGRYTQVHNDVTNVGWHPSHTTYCIRINITAAAVNQFLAIPPDDLAGESAFGAAVVAGQYTDNTANGVLCECYTNDNQNYMVHVSRGRFVALADPNFDNTYNNAYAQGVLANGVLAPNEPQPVVL